mmetsp:Transcript_28447/g.94218  ORF Transcript_28447/g.94218 Transcript_28447/m.94218 type:complete len:221 (+) Transcript_28447:111-773(+)
MEMDRLEEEAQTDVDKEIEEEIEQARAADAAKAASPPPKRGSVLAAVSSKLSTFRLGASPEPAPGDDAAAVSRERYAKRLEDGIEASVECGRVVGGARYYSVRCRRAGFQPATVAHPLTAFRDCRAALRSAGQAELVRSDFPLPRSASLESLGSLFRGDDDARRRRDLLDGADPDAEVGVGHDARGVAGRAPRRGFGRPRGGLRLRLLERRDAERAGWRR